MRILLRPSKVKRADFAFFATPDYRAKSGAFKPRLQGEWNTGLGAQRRFSPLFLQRSFSGAELR